MTFDRFWRFFEHFWRVLSEYTPYFNNYLGYRLDILDYVMDHYARLFCVVRIQKLGPPCSDHPWCSRGPSLNVWFENRHHSYFKVVFDQSTISHLEKSRIHINDWIGSEPILRVWVWGESAGVGWECRMRVRTKQKSVAWRNKISYQLKFEVRHC